MTLGFGERPYQAKAVERIFERCGLGNDPTFLAEATRRPGG
jgi:hypothetical protein